MDPVAAIIDAITADTPAAAAAIAQDVHAWKRGGGFLPTLGDIRREAERRGLALPQGWDSTAVACGAVHVRVVRDGLWFCIDCTFATCNGDTSGIDSPERVAVVEQGLATLGRGLVPDFNTETSDGIRDFSSERCACCGSTLGGWRHRFAILGD